MMTKENQTELLQRCAKAFKMIKELSGNHRIKHESHLMLESIGDYLVHGIHAAPVEAPPLVTGETSDGYHTFNELYEHRHALFSALCKFTDSWKSKLHSDGTMFDGWFIAGINTPAGQATYHLPMSWWDCVHAKELEQAPDWDGHTADDTVNRIKMIASTGRLTLPPAADGDVREAADFWNAPTKDMTELGWKSLCILRSAALQRPAPSNVSSEDAQAALALWMKTNSMIQPVHDYGCAAPKTFKCGCKAEIEFGDTEKMKITIRALLAERAGGV